MDMKECNIFLDSYFTRNGQNREKSIDSLHGRTYAQTNIQLFNQLYRSQYSELDLQYIKQAYTFGQELFTSLSRGSGKPFMCHLVGTASILASLHAPIQIVTAGLLHASYIYGQWSGDDGPGITECKRRKVRAVVGYETEGLIAQYTRLKWNKNTIPSIYEGLENLDHQARQVLLVRLANELEDHLDGGVLYCGNAEQRLEYICSSLYLSVEIAQRIHYPQLAAALEDAFRETITQQLPPVLTGQGRKSTYALAFA
jgi:(p)ppGpp synthase/HD superfamily hydrolase